MGDRFNVTGQAGVRLAALPQLKGTPQAAAPGSGGMSGLSIGLHAAGAAAFAASFGAMALRGHNAFLKAHLDHGPLKWAALATLIGGGILGVVGCGSSGPGETVDNPKPITPAELNQSSSIVKTVLTVGTYEHIRGFVADDQTKFTGQNSTRSSDHGSSYEHHIRNFWPDSLVLGGMQDSSTSITTMGTDATSGHIDHTQVVDPLKTVGQLGLPDGYASADLAIEDVFGRPDALNGFVVIKDGDAYKAEAFAVPPTGVEWIKPNPNVAAVVIGDSVLTPQKVGGSLQLQDSGHVQARAADASGLPHDPTYGLVTNDNGEIDLAGLDKNNPSAGYATEAEALGAALQIHGLQSVVQNSDSKRFFVMDEKTDYPLASKYFDGEKAPGNGIMVMETDGGYMLPSTTGRWRDPSTFKG
jgi:hypothetical protein